MSFPNPGRPSVQDASLSASHALPASEGLSVIAGPIDLGLLHGISERPADSCEVVVTYPAMLLAALPNTSVLTYTIVAATNSALNAGTVTLATWTQTGATGHASQPGGQIRVRLPSNCPEFVGLTVAADANGGTMSGVSATLQLCF